MKFVSMAEINSVFSDPAVDYVVVSNVTDSQLDLEVHLESGKSIAPDRILMYRELLGSKLDRSVSVTLVKKPFISRVWDKLKFWK